MRYLVIKVLLVNVTVFLDENLKRYSDKSSSIDLKLRNELYGTLKRHFLALCGTRHAKISQHKKAFIPRFDFFFIESALNFLNPRFCGKSKLIEFFKLRF